MEYLSKEEIKQWRSSLEKITLEEYAKRLGKAIKNEKHTNDLIDIVLANSSSNLKYMSDSKAQKEPKEEVIEIAQKALEVNDGKTYTDVSNGNVTRRLNFNKPLTEREHKVLEHFIKNQDVIVYAKDLAKILGLPTDYVYKYIKNLRTKIAEDVLQNASKGGYKLSI